MKYSDLHFCDNCGMIPQLLFTLSMGEKDAGGDYVAVGKWHRWCFACIKSQLEETKKVE